jgi:YVTN family beta-propeller protein
MLSPSSSPPALFVAMLYCTLLDAARLVRTTSGADSLTTVDVSDVPTDVAFSSAGNWAYVTNQRARTVGVVDPRTNTQVDAIPVEGDPFRVVVGPEGPAPSSDGKELYAAGEAGEFIVADLERGTEKARGAIHLLR